MAPLGAPAASLLSHGPPAPPFQGHLLAPLSGQFVISGSSRPCTPCPGKSRVVLSPQPSPRASRPAVQPCVPLGHSALLLAPGPWGCCLASPRLSLVPSAVSEHRSLGALRASLAVHDAPACPLECVAPPGSQALPGSFLPAVRVLWTEAAARGQGEILALSCDPPPFVPWGRFQSDVRWLLDVSVQRVFCHLRPRPRSRLSGRVGQCLVISRPRLESEWPSDNGSRALRQSL